MKRRRAQGGFRPGRRSFTLTELMVAVLIVVAVIVATSRIFATASAVTGVGAAGADVLQEAAAIERQIRADLESLSREGFLAIRCVAVRNDVNASSGGGLLHPGLPPSAVVRADQLVFFSHRLHSAQTLRAGAGVTRKGQGTAARVYYGHAFQVPGGPEADLDDDPAAVMAIDPEVVAGNPMTPWMRGQRNFQKIRFQHNAGAPPGDYLVHAPYGALDVTQPPAPRWLLSRQAVLLADDGGSPSVYLFTVADGVGTRSASGITDPVIRHGRVDVAAGELDAIRSFLSVTTSGGLPAAPRPWHRPGWIGPDGFGDQRALIGETVFYPRAERGAPSMSRVDQALTGSVLGSAVSSFIVDWTYESGTGFTPNPLDPALPYPGVRINDGLEQAWFGMDDPDRGVLPLRDWSPAHVIANDGAPIFLESIEPDQLSRAGSALAASGAAVYEAFFGYNQGVALNQDPGSALYGRPDPDLGYTPWPSAVRITMTLHDAGGRLDHGRVVQFVIDL